MAFLFNQKLIGILTTDPIVLDDRLIYVKIRVNNLVYIASTIIFTVNKHFNKTQT